MKRILMVLALALIVSSVMAVTASTVFADPDCTGPPTDRPGACHEGGKPGPSNFVGPGGGSRTANHH